MKVKVVLLLPIEDGQGRELDFIGQDPKMKASSPDKSRLIGPFMASLCAAQPTYQNTKSSKIPEKGSGASHSSLYHVGHVFRMIESYLKSLFLNFFDLAKMLSKIKI